MNPASLVKYDETVVGMEFMRCLIAGSHTRTVLDELLLVFICRITSSCTESNVITDNTIKIKSKVVLTSSPVTLIYPIEFGHFQFTSEVSSDFWNDECALLTHCAETPCAFTSCFKIAEGRIPHLNEFEFDSELPQNLLRNSPNERILFEVYVMARSRQGSGDYNYHLIHKFKYGVSAKCTLDIRRETNDLPCSYGILRSQ